MPLDGPRMGPASGGDAKELVVFLHGLGSNGDDLMGLAPHFAKVAPNAAFVSPNAVQPFYGFPNQYQWFPITDPASITETIMLEGVRAAADPLNAFLDAELERWGVAPQRLALIGFSQGCMMALHVGVRRNPGPSAVIGYSGLLAGRSLLADELVSKPPVFLVHGDRDPVVAFSHLERSAESLAAANVPVMTHVSQGVEHSIGQDGVMLGMRFLEQSFANQGEAAG